MAIKVKGCTVVDDIRNITAGVSTVTTGCVTGTFTGSTICATSCFSGDGSGLSNIPSGAITGLSGGGGVQTFSSPGTFPVPPGTTTLKITATGGGGPGGTGGSVLSGNTNGGGGGGAGSAAVKYLSVPPSCSSYPVTVGGAGGDTIFGGPTVFFLEGGCNGVACFAGCSGNSGNLPSTGTHLLSVTSRRCGYLGPSEWGGNGQEHIFGIGGAGCTSGPTSPGAGCPGCGYGSGGGGGRGNYQFGPGPAEPGGTGAPGFVIVEW